jgi:hypothetical protein
LQRYCFSSVFFLIKAGEGEKGNYKGGSSFATIDPNPPPPQKKTLDMGILSKIRLKMTLMLAVNIMGVLQCWPSRKTMELRVDVSADWSKFYEKPCFLCILLASCAFGCQ